jgi:desulfoferrodoxin-like iron-binding protein
MIAVDHVGEIFHCPICDNEVIVTKVGGGTLYCCGKPMDKIGQEEDQEPEFEEAEESEE